MLYRTSSFKQSSRLVTAATAFALFSGTSLLATQTARADEPSNFAAACASIKDGAKRAGCMIDAIEKDTEEKKKNIARLKAEGDAAVATSECVQFLAAGVKTGAFVKAEIFEKAGGKLNDQNACPVAKQYGFGRKAEAGPSPRFN